MQQSPYAPNIFADGSPYLEGALGLSWFPSQQAKTYAANYEAEILYALRILYSKFSSARVITEIAKNPKHKIVIRPRSIKPGPDEDAESANFNSTTTPANPRDGLSQNLPAPDDDEDVFTTKKTGTGMGSDVVITTNPSMFSDYGKASPAYLGTSDDNLLHELVHGLSQVSGHNAATAGGPAGYQNLEEFTAVIISNVYRSEKQGDGAFLRMNYSSTAMLPMNLRDSGAFYQKYKTYMDQLFQNLSGLSKELSAGTGISHNPFIYYH